MTQRVEHLNKPNKKAYVVYNKNNIDDFYHLNATKETIRDTIINNLDMSKEWTYFSIAYLLKKHKEIADKNIEADYEFIYEEDIINNPSSFQAILRQIEKDTNAED